MHTSPFESDSNISSFVTVILLFVYKSENLHYHPLHGSDLKMDLKIVGSSTRWWSTLDESPLESGGCLNLVVMEPKILLKDEKDGVKSAANDGIAIFTNRTGKQTD
ncbi:hypothetical protein L1887_38280 [Cichorium endivia]|nr:hypothetical protein L1887_38280 [Cichorium endivia]